MFPYKLPEQILFLVKSHSRLWLALCMWQELKPLHTQKNSP